MRPELVGQVLKQTRVRASRARMEDLAQTLGTDSAMDTARVALFFGVTITRDLEVVEKMGMVMDRALMAGHELQWTRPFEPDEEVDVTVTMKSLDDKGDKDIGVVEALFATPGGEEIQRQFSTFVHFKPKS